MNMTLRYLVDAPINAVFRYLANPSLTATDVAPTYRVEPSGTMKLGDVLTLSGPGLKVPWRIEVVELMEPNKITLRVLGSDHPDRVGIAAYALEPAGTKTQVAAEMQTQLARRLEIGARLLQPLLMLQARHGNRKIATAIERRYRAGDLD